MRRVLLVLSSLLVAITLHAAPPAAPSGWQAKVVQTMPLLGHRNWILVVDSAYPLQTSPGVETVETGADQVDVVRFVLAAVGNSIHVRPVVFMDAELPYLSDQDNPGASAYRTRIESVLHGYPVQSLLHEKIIGNVDEAGKVFHILVLKTRMTIPYTSVFIRLDCKYLSADAENRLRAKMAAAGAGPATDH